MAVSYDIESLAALAAANAEDAYIGQIIKNLGATLHTAPVPEQVKLLYDAVCRERILRLEAPLYPEMNADTLRTASKIKEDMRASDADMAFLFLGLLRACGLNGLLILLEEHVLVGCHLYDFCFREPVVRDISAITKRYATGIDEMCVIDCACFFAGEESDFGTARKKAENYFTEAETFLEAVDISCALAPLAAGNGGQKHVYTEYTAEPTASEPKTITKQDVWERKLLDLSFRNPLLSFRPGRMNVPIQIPDIDALEDKLSGGDTFKVMTVPVSGRESDKELCSPLSQGELQEALTKLYRAARHSEEETSVSTLYLALGFLSYTDMNKKPRLAPLVLLPAQLHRKNLGKNYELSLRDEEPQVNITLLELLRQNYNMEIDGLSPIPTDASGVDLRKVFSIVRRAVMEKDGWDVLEEGYLGQFSFARFIMWNDIKNHADDLAQNKIVSSLMHGRLEWTPREDIPSLESLDAELKPSELAVPLSVDSSQLLAIASAAKGQSFVLHGPPGTGKSQTITNMIANALFSGQSVLFVAEKKAALSVVEKRLSKIGLKPFCLELHSNKAQKREVLAQFDEALSVGERKDPEAYTRSEGELHSLRTYLNSVVSELHKKRHYKLSLYEAITRYEQNAEYKGRATFPLDVVTGMGEPGHDIDHYKTLLQQIAVAGEELGSLSESPLRFCRLTEYRTGLFEEMASALKEYRLAALSYMQQVSACAETFGITSTDRNTLKLLQYLISEVNAADCLLPGAFACQNLPMQDAEVRRLLEVSLSLAKCASYVGSVFEMRVSEADVAQWASDYAAAEKEMFLIKRSSQNQLIDRMKPYFRQGASLTREMLPGMLNALSDYKALRGQMDAFNPSVKCILEGMEGKPLNVIAAAYEESLKLYKYITEMLTDTEEYESVMAAMTDLSLKLPSVKEENRLLWQLLESAASKLNETERILSEQYRIRFESLYKEKDYLAETAQAAEAMLSLGGSLKAHTVLMALMEEAEAVGLADYMRQYRYGNLRSDELVPCMECNLSYALICYTTSESEVLKRFDGPVFEESIRKYKEVLERFEMLTVQELVARLSHNVPKTGTQMAASSELNILLKAIKNGGRGMSIRKLFETIPNLIFRLKPCMLMSPLSVAQYIDPKNTKFDLIIFDEASQLPTSEAVGAIARAENCIVVGDPKQLPPTSFFLSQNVDEENYEEEDLESLLDDCLALAMPEEHLLWHYRSKHESLIAYSNVQFYDHKLYTFPSPDSLKSKVSYVHVDGFYDRSGTKGNEAEAEAIVAEIKRRVTEPELYKYSVGVVTFSQAQQSLVEDKLQEACVLDAEFDRLLGEMEEPVFIKNLENVQGDERDVILFSIGYGPDEEGKVSMNFGPVNRDGGWRRLNVAITRSRVEMIVYATLRPEQIDLSRTQSRGVADLKGFLEYAQKGSSVLARTEYVNPDAEYKERPDNSLIEQIAADIEGLSYKTKVCLGESEYKLDIGVLNPENEEEFIMGIMVDGPNYAGAATSRDRNISEPSVLKGLGWNLMRIWTLDYLDNRERVLSRVEENLQILLKGGSLEEHHGPVTPKEVVFERAENTGIESNAKPYEQAALTSHGNGVEVYEPQAMPVLVNDINDVILREAPISRIYLYKRVLSAWNITRLSDKSRALLDELTTKMRIRYTSSGGMDYFWRIDQNPATYACYRVPVSEEQRREISEICTEELAAAVFDIVRQQVSLTRDDLSRMVTKVFGLKRTTEDAKEYVERAVELCLMRGSLKEDGERIAVNVK